MISTREIVLSQWIGAQQRQALRAMDAAIEASDAPAHAIQKIKFDTLQAVWQQLHALQQDDNEGSV